MVNRIGAEIEMYMLEMREQQEIDGKMRFQILRATAISSMDLLTRKSHFVDPEILGQSRAAS